MERTGKKQEPAVKVIIYLLLFALLTGATLYFEWRRENNCWSEIIANSETNNNNNGYSDDTSSIIDESTEPDETDDYPVYLVGAVKFPGIYKINPGTCLFELVEKAGGLTADAAANSINLAMLIQPHQHIYIPDKEEVRANPSLTDNFYVNNPSSKKVDINYADQKSLEALPGIGPVTARAIIEYREKNGPFVRVEDLMLVPGIKESRFAALCDLIMVNETP